jgi:hypothetical protein
MSFRDYLHEKAEESRHNETSAYMMFLAGVIFFVGGILTTLDLRGDLKWFLILPYVAETSEGAFLGLALLISGIALAVFGILAGMSYSKDRNWYMQELRKANSMEASLMSTESPKKKNGRRKKNNTA